MVIVQPLSNVSDAQSAPVPATTRGQSSRPSTVVDEHTNTPDSHTPATPSDQSNPVLPPLPAASTVPNNNTTPRPLAKCRQLRPKTQNRAGVPRTATQRGRHVNVSHELLKVNSKVLKKFVQIGEEEATAILDEYLLHTESRGGWVSSLLMPSHSAYSLITRPPKISVFFGDVPKLAGIIECSGFGEMDYRVRKRIALAHFYHAYTVAQDNPRDFLSWCDCHRLQASILRRGSLKSAVLHRFTDLVFCALKSTLAIYWACQF